MRAKMWKLSLYLFIVGFILNMLGIVSHVVVSSFAKRWFGGLLPPAFTTDWFTYAWKNFDLGQVLWRDVPDRGGRGGAGARDRISRRPISWRGEISASSRPSCCCTFCRW